MRNFLTLAMPLLFIGASLAAMPEDMNQNMNEMNMNDVQTTDKGMMMGENEPAKTATSTESFENGQLPPKDQP